MRGLGDFGFGVPSTTHKLGGADEEEGHDDLNEDDLKVPIEFPPEPGSLAFLSPSDGSS